MKRLGLPVHGRWVRTYTNPIAHNYIQKVLADKNPILPLSFPCGSFIVKENYGSSVGATTINQQESMLGILTIMYKSNASFNFCGTPHLEPYNGTDCYGGDWFYGFYNLDTSGHAEITKLSENVQRTAGAFCVNCHAAGFKADYVRTLAQMKFPYAQQPTESYCAQFAPYNQPMLLSADPIPEEISKCVEELDVFCNAVELSNTIPPDVPCDPVDIMKYYGKERTQQMFDCFGWRTFVALNFPNVSYDPADPQRGVPVASGDFVGAGQNPRVWETYKTAYEVFQPDSVEWNPVDQQWNEARPFPRGDSCKGEEIDLVLTMASKARDVPNETGQAFAGSFGYVVDRNRKDVRYEVLFNRTEFEYIIDGDRAATRNITPGGPSKNGELLPVKFPDNRTDSKWNVGAIEIKSAWKELCVGQDCNYADASSLKEAQKKFYVRNLLIYDEVNDSCRRADMALIGLHVIHKTHFAPQWIWLTFEHKGNVPDSPVAEEDYTFFDPKHPPDNSLCFKLPFLSENDSVIFCPNVDLNRFKFRDQPNQLTRLMPIDTIAESLNTRFSDLYTRYDSPLANYKLVNVQWPINGRRKDGTVNTINCADNGKGEDCFTIQPQFLRNSVIESFMSTYCTEQGRNLQFSNRSCMGCHGQVGSDFSYIWLDGVSQRVPIRRDGSFVVR